LASSIRAATSISTPIPTRARAAVLDLYRLALDADEPAIFATAVELAVAMTGSEIGYFHLVNEDQETIELGTWSAATLQQCTAVYDRHYPISEAGVWADSARERRACIHNDYQALAGKRGLPEGHVVLRRHMGVPVLCEGRVVLLVGVGNKPTEYDRDDLACFQALADEAWVLIRRRREQAALELAERQLRELQEIAVISVWQWDPDERTLVCDATARRIFGAEFPGAGPCSLDALLRVVDPRDRRALQQALETPAADASFGIDLRAIRSDGRAITVHFHGSAHPRSQGHGIILRGILQDVTERRELSRIRYQAGHDVLTGLANRAALLAELEAALRNRRRRPDRSFALLFVDLDHFKEVNDSLGHLAGDAVLKGVAKRLQQATRGDDVVARIGGDEMVVLQKHVTGADAATTLASRIIDAIGKPIDVAGTRVELGASIGIAVADDGPETPEELLSRADRAMYRAKETRRGGYCVA
jgi:diguanylate cyclase (GGDEF)-like protein